MNPKKRPCRYCRRWFKPAPKLRGRQYACSTQACQKRRKADNQADWLERNPSYFQNRSDDHREYRRQNADTLRVRRRERHQRDRQARRSPSPPKVTPPAEQDAFTSQVIEKQGDATRVLLSVEQDAWRALVLVVTEVACRVPVDAEQDSMASALATLHDLGDRLSGGASHERTDREATLESTADP